MSIKRGPLSSPHMRYGVSVGIAAAALLSYKVLVMLVGGALPTYLTFYPVVILTALFAGLGAGLLTTATAALLTAYFILPPEGLAVSSLPDTVGLVIFSFNGTLISVTAELYHRARQRAADYAGELAIQEERKMAAEALQMKEARLHLAHDAAKAGAWEWDIHTNKNVWSEELWKLYGLEPHCCEPTYEAWRQTVHPDDREKVEQIVQGAAANHTELNAEWRVRDRDGSLRWLMSRGRPFCDTEGQVVRYIGIVMDITERKQMEETLKERSWQLEAANSELDSFAYSVSHDLRAPLRAIDGYARMILRMQGERFDENTTRQFNLIRDNAKIMGRLIDDLLALSRLGRAALSISLFDLEVLARDVWEEQKSYYADRSIEMTINPMPPATGDPSLIRQVLINLLSNAVKFSKARETPRIEIGGWRGETENVYYVRDNGVGFDMHYHDKLFGVFQRLHSGTDYEGSGVGLSIVQRIIHRHGGQVWAEGEIENGATFYFSLPAMHRE